MTKVRKSRAQAGPGMCPWCGRGPFRRLVSHTRPVHGVGAEELAGGAGAVGAVASNATAVESTLAALRFEGRLSDTDDALVALVRNLAVAVDEAPGNAALWREFRAAVQSLREVGTDDIDDDTAAFRISIRTPVRASVGDTSES